MHDVTIAIASFNTLPLTRVVCGAVRATAPGAELIVVDAGSTDGSREWAAGRVWLRLETLAAGLLGAAAHAAALDRALSASARPLLCALDSDAVPLQSGWLDALRGSLEGELSDGGNGTGGSPPRREPPATAVGTTKDPGEVGALRRLWARLRGRGPGPEWTYLRPNRALYRVEAIRRSGLGFSAGVERGRVGEALARALAAEPGGVRLLPPERMEALIAHVRHATLALNPGLFPSARARDVRAARRRVEGFLASDVARRWAAEADRG